MTPLILEKLFCFEQSFELFETWGQVLIHLFYKTSMQTHNLRILFHLELTKFSERFGNLELIQKNTSLEQTKDMKKLFFYNINIFKMRLETICVLTSYMKYLFVISKQQEQCRGLELIQITFYRNFFLSTNMCSTFR